VLLQVLDDSREQVAAVSMRRLNQQGDVRGLRPGQYSRENVIDQLGLYARYGITTVVSLGGDGEEGVQVREAVERVLDTAGVKLTDIAAVEIVEAFAGQVLAVTDALGLDPLGRDADVVCADGGALALGHPWGATGAVVVVRLFSRLVRGGAPAGTMGLATAAVGGGLGVAALFEVVRGPC
jgi:acetyl-CoA acetyltransferase